MVLCIRSVRPWITVLREVRPLISLILLWCAGPPEFGCPANLYFSSDIMATTSPAVSFHHLNGLQGHFKFISTFPEVECNNFVIKQCWNDIMVQLRCCCGPVFLLSIMNSTSVAGVCCSKSHEVHSQSGRVIDCVLLSQICGVPVSQLSTGPLHQLTLHELYWETLSVAGHGLEPH